MFVTGECKKCKGRVIFDIADMTQEQVETLMNKTDFGHCSVGWHVEVGKMANYYVLDWKNKFNTQIEAEDHNKKVREARFATI